MKSKRRLLIIVVALLITFLMVFSLFSISRHQLFILIIYALSIGVLWLLWEKADSLQTTINTDYLLSCKKPVTLNATVYFRYGKMEHYNWGDDMNYYLLSDVLRLPTALYNFSFLRKFLPGIANPNYLVIGSTITMLTNPNTVIWGAGVVDDKEPLPCKPKKVLAVRGPKTREYLLQKGVECPAVYGDPILLLKYFYRPNIKKKYKIGVIPHYTDYNDEKFNQLKADTNVLFIKMKDYSGWKDVIDKVLSCEYIVSSSLHGLVLAETYSIPSLWIQVSDKIRGGVFKYRDFYESIHITDAKPYSIHGEVTAQELLDEKNHYKKGVIDLSQLINSSPFRRRLLEIINQDIEQI